MFRIDYTCILTIMAHEIRLNDVENLLFEAYVPFAEIDRAITWPSEPERLENDAEHTFSLALVSGSVAGELGLDADKAASLAIVHDLVEVYAGDTSVWDDAGLETKEEREAAALSQIKEKFDHTWLTDSIHEYETLGSEEARLVYALDKLLAVLMLAKGNGHFWKSHGITFEAHYQRYCVKRPQVAQHPTILEWYDEVHRELEARKEEFFAPEK